MGRAILAALVMLLPAAAVPADGDFPTRPVTLVVPYTPGGSADAVARALAEQLRAGLAQPVIVENRPGAGTAIASDHVARARPDGYTLLLAGSSFTIAPATGKTSYDPVRDFAPVSRVLDLAMFLVVRADLPVRSLAELIAYARAHPGKLAYGSVGEGSITHFQMELFKSLAGVDVMHVPYQGAAPVLNDLLGGRLSLAFDGLASAGPHIRAGTLRPLVVAMPERAPQLAEVPTFAEAGLSGYEATAWTGVLAPAGTPPQVVERLNRAINDALAAPVLQERIRGIGGTPRGSTPAGMGEMIASETRRWAGLYQRLSGR